MHQERKQEIIDGPRQAHVAFPNRVLCFIPLTTHMEETGSTLNSNRSYIFSQLNPTQLICVPYLPHFKFPVSQQDNPPGLMTRSTVKNVEVQRVLWYLRVT